MLLLPLASRAWTPGPPVTHRSSSHGFAPGQRVCGLAACHPVCGGGGCLLLWTDVGIGCVFAVLVLESEPVDPGLPGLQALRHDGEACCFALQLIELDCELSTLAFHFPLPGQGRTS